MTDSQRDIEGAAPERGDMASSGNWLECSIYQNYTASEVLVQGLAGVVNQVSLSDMTYLSMT